MIPYYGACTGGKSGELASSYVRFLEALYRAGRAAVGLLVAALGLVVRCLVKGPRLFFSGLLRGFRKPESIAARLARVRAARNPTPRGQMLCSQIMGQMLPFNWDRSTLDSLEILFWETRDADGNELPPDAQKKL